MHGIRMWSLIDVAVLAAVVGILPACLGHRRLWWAASVAVALSCASTNGTAFSVVAAFVWPAIAVVVGLRVARTAWPSWTLTRQHLVAFCAAGYGFVAACWFVASRAGATPFGIYEPIVELTAVHFTYVGVAAVVLADAALARCDTATSRAVGWTALGLTVAAPPVVAIGFTTGAAVPQVGGAVLLSVGVFSTAALELRTATKRHGVVRWAYAVSGLSVWGPMALAVSWAAALHYDVPALSTAAMVRTHGAANAIGFVAAGLTARHLDRNADADPDPKPSASSRARERA